MVLFHPSLRYDLTVYKLTVTLLLVLFLFFPIKSSAKESNQFITIVNPIRISIYGSNPGLSLANQYNLVKINNFPASWLFTYDALSYQGMIQVIKSMDKNQDIGILLEVTENSAQAAGVKYNKTDSWHRSTSVFLSGYTQADRLKLIDSVFNKFKNELGYYPTSVGAWWVDSYSLNYMQKKYRISANLVVSDQFETDGYTVWGQFWGAPYYPSVNHSAIPASTLENKIDVVNIQWAPRDPLNGYISPSRSRASLYSTQDYYTVPLSEEYFEKLINLYAAKNSNNFGQITFGLEGDFPPQSYLQGGQYEKYIITAKKFSDSGNFTVFNMQQFSNWYREKYPISESYLSVTDDLLGKPYKSIWYQTSHYRVGVILDQANHSLKIVDLRIYQKDFQEPFYVSPNKQLDLFINLPAVIDTSSIPNNFLEFKNIILEETLRKSDGYQILFDKKKSINLEEDQITFQNFNQNIPNFFLESPYIQVIQTNNRINILAKSNFLYNENGYVFRGLTPVASYFLKQNKVKTAFSLGLLIFLFAPFILKRFLNAKKEQIVIFSLFLLTLSIAVFFYYQYSQNYYVSQAELDSLTRLKSLPKGNILVLNKDCLQCQWTTKFKPAAFSNKRSYVKKFSQKELILDNKLVEFSSNNLDSKTELKKESAYSYLKGLNVKYIFLVKHEDYQEKLPFSPGDLGVERIFVNSDSEIWEFKD